MMKIFIEKKWIFESKEDWKLDLTHHTANHSVGDCDKSHGDK